MKIRQIASLVGAVALMAISAAPAFAATVSRADGQSMNPNGEPFSASGVMRVGKGTIWAACTATFNGTISSTGIVNITSTQFTGAPLCSFFVSNASSASPWAGQVDSTTQLSINNAQMTVSVLGACGPGRITATWKDSDSSLIFNEAVLPRDCVFAGMLATSPKFHVQ
ncbi:activator protein [Burkholderia contaminans]|uniref:activator protein n=1 Tax=Burkholderia contaminans TaxID=488447 RepID=UPI001CF57635|nr:activator protein [Burkholderia contaminans]MCA7918006.1 activator protein [Burkholderia contaminans]MCA8098394.1 activator protein [Burkholderia contaminans]UUX41218.1 activator protein [Burkholderia contaminans]